ncbi:hypothetical protein SLNWT_2229 [Streptomyces albus]|uniref:Uncharacterized protein n=1 Tax=Streptomyces albus (strain ATCC 21838 / DSM 41398 / FERM P-419 / JCM 4703 / NBRC 107858) TaxID=1081613 RepID=A0A0B5ETM8_STRA4|nr:hypothetical protein SLNWT_2229 [Streptomyces albus]AOU76919.1 hypothetical protein SLNHY_2228 [Streptomyces albus]AYN32697.1 hypothetical protein DUI70_2194 [Streptomyces albus]
MLSGRPAPYSRTQAVFVETVRRPAVRRSPRQGAPLRLSATDTCEMDES